MANWKHQVNISSLLNNYGDDKITPVQFAHRVADKLKELNIQDEEFEEIVQNFRDVNESDTEEDIDYLLRDLYDWGDVEHRLWVNSI